MMKRKTFYGIEFFEIGKKERNDFLKAGGVLKDTILEETLIPGNAVFLMPDKRVIFEVAGVRIYLFDNKKDYLFFLKKTNAIANESVSYDMLITDEKFIENQELYLAKLKKDFALDILIWDINSLMLVDEKIANFNADNLKEYALSLVALIGKCLIVESKKGEWRYVDDPIDGRTPMIVIAGDLISPIKVIQDLIKKRGNGKRVSISEVVNGYVSYYKD